MMQKCKDCDAQIDEYGYDADRSIHICPNRSTVDLVEYVIQDGPRKDKRGFRYSP